MSETESVKGEVDLRAKILQEMVGDYQKTLQLNFDRTKTLITLSPVGGVIIRTEIIKKLKNKQQVLLYLVGKHYAKEAGLVESEYATNDEIMQNLLMTRGSIFPVLTDLDKNKLIVNNADHSARAIPLAAIDQTLNEIEAELKK